MTTTRSEPTSTPTANGNFVVDPALVDTALVGARPAEPAPATQTCELSIVLPCLNEAETLATCIRKAQRSLRGWASTARCVIADNGVDRRLPGDRRAPRAPASCRCRAGYGAALLGGIEAARGQLRPHGRRRRQLRPRRPRPASSTPCATAPTWSWATASRAASSPAPCRRCTATSGNPVLSWVGRLFFRSPDRRLPLRDARLPPRPVHARWACAPTGMEFASEMVVRASLPGAAHRGGADAAAPRRPQPAAAPAHLARRLAPPALPASRSARAGSCCTPGWR